MNRNGLTTTRLVEIWEDRRDIKNLMGKYVNCLILNREQDVYTMFWSGRDDICLGFNDGWYAGALNVEAYYNAVYEDNKLKASVLQRRFPEELGDLSDEEVYGVGDFKVKPIGSALIEVSADGETAKGLWHCMGAYAEVTGKGPAAYWTWGYFCVDFIREEDEWKIWHMQHVNDIDSPCGLVWDGRSGYNYPEIPEFAELKGHTRVAPNVPQKLREYYSSSRAHTPAPRLPEPYRTFSETFSYGFGGAI